MAQESGWQLSGPGPAAWERYLAPVIETWAEDLVRRAGLRPGDRVLDVGTGTGLVARTAARHVRWTGKVTGVDVNPAMLEIARRVAALIHPPIEWVEQAGWRDIHIEIRVDHARYPSVRELVRYETESMPIPSFWEAFARAGDAMAKDLEEALADYKDDDGLVFPCEGYVVEARK